MQQDYPTLNDFAPSWADIRSTFSVYGGEILDMVDYSAITWSDTVEVGEQRGASGGLITRRTTGSVSQEATATLYRSGHRKLVRALAKRAPLRGNQRRIALVGFDIQIKHTPPGETDIYLVKIKGCRLLGRNAQAGEGNDADKVEINLNPMQIVEVVDGEEIVLL